MKHYLNILLLTLLFPVMSFAQVLEIVPDKIGEVVKRTPHCGVTFSGTSGLLTIPTPDFQDNKVGLSHKSGIIKRTLIFEDQKYKLRKNEHYSAFQYHIRPNLEFSVNHLYYSRESDIFIEGLNYSDKSTAFGLKYSAHNGSQDFCFGVSFAPMDTEELNRADLLQIENLRSLYMTVSETLCDSLTGYLNAKVSVTADQKIDFGKNRQLKLDRNEFIISGIGLEYNLSGSASLFGEGKFANYRDLFEEDSTRFDLNAGIRIGGGNFQLEAAGMSLQKDPDYFFGVGLGF